MSAFTISLSNSLLNEAFRNVEYSQPTTVYAALFTTATDTLGNGTEVTGGSYARQSITFSAASGGVITNSNTITFPTATAAWGTISYFAVMSASSGGTMMAEGPLTNIRIIGLSETYTISAGAITIGVS